MKRMLDRISVDPNVCFGKPCIKGTRIWVSLILDFLASGMSFDEILEEYPSLTIEDIRAAIDYGSEMSSPLGRNPKDAYAKEIVPNG